MVTIDEVMGSKTKCKDNIETILINKYLIITCTMQKFKPKVVSDSFPQKRLS